MALIACPECGTKVSDKAEKCPSCAFPINRKEQTTTINRPPTVVKEKEGCFLQTLNCGCIFFLVVLGIAAMIGIFAFFSGTI